MDPEATQPEKPLIQGTSSIQQFPSSAASQPPDVWSEPSSAANPPPQQPFFVPGPPVSQQVTEPMVNDPPAAVEDQPYYPQQPVWKDNYQEVSEVSWNDNHQEPSWNGSRQEPSWNGSYQEPSWNDSHQEPSWNDSHQEPPWNDSGQSSWSEGVRNEEPKKVEPPPPKGIKWQYDWLCDTILYNIGLYKIYDRFFILL